jgi:LPXTG-motif cell wall-anchored protein
MRYLLKLLVVLVLMAVSLQSAAAAEPGFTVVSPKDGATIDGTDVTVDLKTIDFKLVPSTVPLSEAGKHPELNRPGEGHYHFVLDLRPLVVWDKDATYTFTNVPPGEHQLMIEMANIDHSSLSPPIMKQIKFRTTSAQALPQTGVASSSEISAWLALFMLSLFMVSGGWLVLRRKHV